MKRGLSNQLTKQIGEYLVAAELARRGFLATPFSGNVPDFDLVVVDEHLRSFPIQVKAFTGSFQIADSREFLVIDQQLEQQKVRGLKELPFPTLIYVLVQVIGTAKDEFYILTKKELQAEVAHSYEAYLARHGGQRPKNSSSYHMALSPQNLNPYKNRWKIMEEQFLANHGHLG